MQSCFKQIYESQPSINGSKEKKTITSAFLNESEFIHSKDKAVSIQGSLNPGLTLSGLQSSLPPPQCLLFFYSTVSAASIRTLGIQRRHSENFVKEPYRLHNRFFLGWLESNLLPILLSDTKGALPRHDYAEITFLQKAKAIQSLWNTEAMFLASGGSRNISTHSQCTVLWSKQGPPRWVGCFYCLSQD